VIRVLERLRLERTYVTGHFELAFLHNFKDEKGRKPNLLKIKRTVRTIIRGDATLKMIKWVDRMEEFTDLVTSLGKKK
jgi:hypothetical protein